MKKLPKYLSEELEVLEDNIQQFDNLPKNESRNTLIATLKNARESIKNRTISSKEASALVFKLPLIYLQIRNIPMNRLAVHRKTLKKKNRCFTYLKTQINI